MLGILPNAYLREVAMSERDQHAAKRAVDEAGSADPAGGGAGGAVSRNVAKCREMSRCVAAGRKARNEANRGAGTGGVAERRGRSRFVARERKAPSEPKWAHAAAAGGAGVADRGGDGVGGRGSAGRRAADGGALEKAPALRRRGRPIVRRHAGAST